ncbi:hypothetical protein GQ53DRAFT_749364 [Thozetella sp. PMI_491]|nr:hypothetical protein GQ53DRAFT_749364 [Thozetella sp. PMI_491]
MMTTTTKPPAWLAAVMNSSVDPSRLPPTALIDMNELNAASEPETEDEIEDENVTFRRRLADFAKAIAPLDRDAVVLEIDGDTPTDEEWRALEGHFRCVRKLNVNSGFEERWIDESFPLTWPLELLVVSSATAELVTTPAIVEGRVEHLVLELTCGLTFEASSTADLVTLSNHLEEQGEDETIGEELDEILRIAPNKPTSRLKTLEILENDAIETFARLTFAHPNIVLGLEHLNLRSTMGFDMTALARDLPLMILPRMKNLKCLKLSMGNSWRGTEKNEQDGGEAGGEKDLLASLHKRLPRNLETFHFRGPTALAQGLEGWVSAFKDLNFLPSLKGMSFVLDLGADTSSPDEVREEDLEAARAACRNLLDVASARGIEVLQFNETWGDDCVLFKPVDRRWDKLLP